MTNDTSLKKLSEGIRLLTDAMNASQNNLLTAQLLSPTMATVLPGPLSFNYNASRRLESIDYTGGTVDFTYDGSGRLSTITDSISNVVKTINYNADNSIDTIVKS